MSATRITDDSFLDSEIADKWYKDGDIAMKGNPDHFCREAFVV